MSALSLNEIMTTDPETAPPDTTMDVVLASMEKYKISCIVATDKEQRPVGIFTEQDAICLMAGERPISELTISDVMSSSLLTARGELGFHDAYRMMTERSYRHLLVVDEAERLIGLVSEADFLHHMGMEYMVELKTVSANMTREVVTLTPSDSLAKAVHLMAEHRISCVVIICGDGAPVGMLTERDIIHLAQLPNQNDIPVERVMRSPVISCFADMPMQEAARLMEMHGIRRLVATGASGALAGIITRHDIVKALQGRYVEYLHETLARTSRDLQSTRSNLREAQQKVFLLSLMEQVNDAIYIIESDSGRILEINDRACNMLGYRRNELRHKTAWEISTHIRDAQDWKAMQKRQKIRGSLTQRTYHRKRDGTLVPVEVNAKYLRHETKDYSLAVARDMTHIHRQEKKLLLLREALEATANAIVITDTNAAIQWANPAFHQLSGYARDEVNGLSIDQIIEAEQQNNDIHTEIWQAMEQRTTWRGETCNTRKDGSHYQASVTLTPVSGGARDITHFIAVIEDVTERHHQMTRQRLYATLFENTREGVMVTDGDGIICMVNRAFSELTGYRESEVLGQTPRILQSGKHDHHFYHKMWRGLNEAGHWQGEIWNRRKNGEIYPELLSISAVYGDQGELRYYVGVFSDISQLKQTEAKLEYLAHHDPLTHLANRRLLMSQLEYGLKSAGRNHEMMALLVLDLDRFKDINDSYGHLVGDQLLQLVAGRLSGRLRESDLVSRLGGDEFAVLVQDLINPGDAAMLASEIIRSINEPWRLPGGLELQIGASIGISLFPDHGDSAETLLQHADTALYQAKNEGRGRFRYFSEELTQAARQRIEIHNNLRHALTENKLSVHYQPQIDFANGKIVGAEALLHWHDPQAGDIPPSRFIPVAEETGLINRIGEWVLREVCIQGKSWLESGHPPLSLAVNLSAHQLRQGDLVEMITRIVNRTGYPPGQLSLEVTESALMARETEAVATLN
ncbi:MAG: PAS domain S-box protein, partial [Candidatus Thiodiazotropha sp. (ex Dulcina madagascariensis)]|nr:PAS domain S-box protein [Candidatus Thiodiazotropha sp. (ex Dulcina madagascariensis)]